LQFNEKKLNKKYNLLLDLDKIYIFATSKTAR